MTPNDHIDWIALSELRKAQAQLVTEYVINGRPYSRIPYGDEPDDWGADEGPCHDCGITNGQYHTPGCDVERCPKCGNQAITCDCSFAEHPTRWRPGPAA